MEATMENVQSSRSTHPLMIGAAIAVILFCVAGFAAVMGWIPKSGADSQVPPVDAKASAPAPAKAAASKASQSTAAKPHPLQVAAAPAARPICKECGVVDAIREVQKEGEAKGVGAVAGGVLGGVVGHQMGNGRGRDVMTVVGAVGGAVAGNQIEKNMKKTTTYETTVRFEDGSTRVLSQSAAPGWRVGDRVKLVDGQLRPNA
jgi:outer membrane lipoprotein SlyB